MTIVDGLFTKLQEVANRELGINREMREESMEALMNTLQELTLNQTKRYCVQCGRRLKKRSGPIWHIKCDKYYREAGGVFDPITGERL